MAKLIFAALLLFGSLPLLAACDNADAVVDAALVASPDASRTTPGVGQDVAAVRAATARFHRFEVAQAAGWFDPTAECVEVPGLGGMGYHHVNGALVDGEVAVTEPEVLLYEPQQNGRLRLVAVEYIIPFAILPPDSDPPVLFGEEFHANPFLELWALHAWVWEHNPTGMFEDFNPRVTCDHA